MLKITDNCKPLTGLHRELKARHLTMIAIGGSIGTGLFVASGASIFQSGPEIALLSYSLIGLMVYFLMSSLCEIAAYMPVSGSFVTYGAKYVEESFGFALGWNYWYNWTITISIDLVASQLIMNYWLPNIPGWIWSIIFLSIIFLLNIVSVKGFGESEYWFSLIKVVTVIIFIFIGILMIIGIIRRGEQVGWGSWSGIKTTFPFKFSSIINTAMIVGFSFQGIELIGIAAGESKDPEKNIPRAIRQVFWRILLFYILSILIISLIIPCNSLYLINNYNSDITISPFTLVFLNAGFLSAATIMNIVILTSVLSAGNSGMYASTRILYTLALENKAPKIFSRLSKNGIPYYALYLTTLVSALCFFSSMYGSKTFYFWLLNTSGMTGFIAWLGIAISHYRFRKGYIKQGYDLKKLPYRSNLFPFGPIFSFLLCITVMFGQNCLTFLEKNIDWNHILTTYIGLPVFLFMWLSHKFFTGSRIITYKKMTFLNSIIKP